MTQPRPAATPLTAYRESLILALRLRDVPGDRIGEIVAEVESHVTDTGEDPTEAFGAPGAYAASATEGHRPDSWWSTAFTIAWALSAGWFLAQGVFAVVLRHEYRGQSGWWFIALGLAIGLPGAIALARRSTPVRDPRTGADMVPANPRATAALVATPLLIVGLTVVVTRLLS